jgi:hypothetical protein
MLAAGLEIDRVGEAFLRLRPAGLVEAQPLGRAHRTLVDAGDLTLARHGLSAAGAVLEHDAGIGRQRRQLGALDRRVDNAVG